MIKISGWGLIENFIMYSTQGIVLKKMSVGEADAIFTIYTQEYGKMRALAQGVKKEEAKLKGHLEVFNLINLGFVLGRNGERLTQASLLNSWPDLRSNWNKLSAAHMAAELVDRGCMAGEKDLKLWSLLEDSMRGLEMVGDFEKKDYTVFVRDFEKKLSVVLGYGENGVKKIEYAYG